MTAQRGKVTLRSIPGFKECHVQVENVGHFGSVVYERIREGWIWRSNGSVEGFAGEHSDSVWAMPEDAAVDLVKDVVRNAHATLREAQENYDRIKYLASVTADDCTRAP